MEKIDYMKQLKHLYAPSAKKVEIVDVPEMNFFIENSGSERVGKHHEMYLSDIRRAAPEKWKTIVRQPMS